MPIFSLRKCKSSIAFLIIISISFPLNYCKAQNEPIKKEKVDNKEFIKMLNEDVNAFDDAYNLANMMCLEFEKIFNKNENFCVKGINISSALVSIMVKIDNDLSQFERELGRFNNLISKDDVLMFERILHSKEFILNNLKTRLRLLDMRNDARVTALELKPYEEQTRITNNNILLVNKILKKLKKM